MSESSTANAETRRVAQKVDDTPQKEVDVQSPRVGAPAPPAPILITEQQVVFSTAAATAARPNRRWKKAVRAVAAATRWIFVAAPADSRPERRHYPARFS